MVDADRHATSFQEPAELVGDHDRTVASSRAPHGDREVGLALRDVTGDDDVEQRLEALHELAVLTLILHVVANPLVGARQRPQGINAVPEESTQ